MQQPLPASSVFDYFVPKDLQQRGLLVLPIERLEPVLRPGIAAGQAYVDFMRNYGATVGEIVVSALWEPADYALTIRDIYNDPWSFWSYVGLAPVVPGTAGRFLKDYFQHGDEIVGLSDEVIDLGSDSINTSVLRVRSAKYRVPWSYGNTGGALGATDKFGNITIRPGLAGREFTETVAHESVHRLLGPRPTSFLGEFRADVGMAAYNRSHFVRFVEEAAAETWATGSLRQGIAFPFWEGYVTGTRVFVEGVGYVTVVGGTAYVGYHAVQEDAR